MLCIKVLSSWYHKSEDAVHHMHHSITGLVIDIDDMRHSEDTGQRDLVREGGHCHSLPGPRDEGGGALREVWAEESSPRNVPQ